MSAEPRFDGARLAALRDLGILDTEPEEAFDRFTRLAGDLMDVPIALVSLIDEDRQFFKSQHGLPEPWAQARQTPLSHSLCQHTVQRKRPLVVDDARSSSLVGAQLAARDLDAIAYAGVPLLLDGEHAVGTLCAIDTRPRRWSERDLRILGDLGAAVTTLLHLRQALAERSLHDRLTGLPGRALTVAYCEQLREVHGGDRLLGLVVSIDDFGPIGEAHGSARRDQVVKRVGRRIAWPLAPDDVLGHLDGGTFVVVRPGITAAEPEARDLAAQIDHTVGAESITVSGHSLSVGVTVGFAHGLSDETGRDLIARAESAMHQARLRADRIRATDQRVTAESAVRRRMRAALRVAVSRGEIAVVFQPIVELDTGRARGFEALARWHHPRLGEVSPADFIPASEATGDIVAIGEHVLRTACRELASWRARYDAELQLTVNVSSVQLALPNIPDVVLAILVETGVPAAALGLEITEGVLLSRGTLELRNLARLRVLGVQIALDDFGIGDAAFGSLKRLSLDVIKLDRCFRAERRADYRDVALLRAILSIGSGMRDRCRRRGRGDRLPARAPAPLRLPVRPGLPVRPPAARRRDPARSRCRRAHPDRRLTGSIAAHIRNSPYRISCRGALPAADSASPSASRVSRGSITPSSHSRAVA